MGKTKISWTDRSVNPIRFGKGHYCQKISPGCANCYASRMQPRFGNPEFGGVGDSPVVIENGVTNGQYLWLDEKKLYEPLRVTKPSMFFWCDMTDMFAKWVPDSFIDKCFAVMAFAHKHTHQVLTKRPERMHEYLTSHGRWDAICRAAYAMPAIKDLHREMPTETPPRNIWLGVSCEDQKRANERIPILLKTPARVRFVSAEPLLGPIDFNAVRYMQGSALFVGEEGGHEYVGSRRNLLNWVITGCESGPGRRPFDIAWDWDIQGQCNDAGVAFFRKQIIANGKVSKNMAEWEMCYRVQEFPTARSFA